MAFIGFEKLESLLQGNSLAREIKYYEKTASTNEEASVLAEKGAVHGTLVLADEQSSGKGREGRRWFTSPGKGVALSIVLRPEIPPSLSQWIPMAAAVAVARAIEKRISRMPEIRWPNDVFVTGKKISGILAEGKTLPQRLSYVVLGIGLNVNDAPPDIPEEAASLRLETGVEHDRAEVVALLLSELESWLVRVLQEGSAPVLGEWKRFSTCHEGVRAEVLNGERRVRGVTCGISQTGALRIFTDTGSTEEILSGHVIYRFGEKGSAEIDSTGSHQP